MGHLQSSHRRLRNWVLLFVALGAAVILTMAAPVPLWRTGREAATPLSLTAGGPIVLQSDRLWIDTDAACGATPTTDPDDCLAIAWLAQHDRRIIGISTGFGNASGEVVFQTTKTLVAKIAEGGHVAIPVWRGWSGPIIVIGRSGVPPSRAALRAALAEGPLTILALGPLTNVADALEGRPDLQQNVTRLVAVMGHQPGHLFHPSEASGRGMLMGHGPIFRDLNFDKDEAAARSILQMHLPLTLIPYDASIHAGITAADLEALERQGPVLSWAADTAKGWLDFWQRDIGQPGFYPFDWVAAAYAVEPRLFNCAETNVRIAREWAFWIYPRESLLVGTLVDQPHAATLYCPQTALSLHDYLLTHKARK
jgi:purine nucleosidase